MLAAYLRLPRLVYVLAAGTFVHRAGTMLIPFMTIYMREELGQDVGFATLAVGLFGLGSLVGQTVGGHLADQFGRRVVMLSALFGGATVMAALSFVHHAALFLTLVLVLAVVAEMLRPAVQAALADIVPPPQRPYSFALMYVCINLGFAVGPMLGGLLAEYSFRLIFLADAAAASLYGLIVLLRIPETSPRHAQRAAAAMPSADETSVLADSPAESAAGTTPAAAEGRVSLPAALRLIARDRTFVGLCVATFFIATVFMQSMSTFPLYLQQLGVGPATYGRIIAVNGWLIVLLQVPLTAWTARYPRKRMLAVSGSLTALGVALQGLAAEPWQFAVAVGVWTLGEIIQAPLIAPIIADLAPAHLRGRYMGVFGMSFSGGNMVGVPLGGQVLQRLGGPVVWAGCAVLALVATAIYLSLRLPAPARGDQETRIRDS